MQERNSARLTIPQKPNDFDVNNQNFFQIQHERGIEVQVLPQFTEVFGLKVSADLQDQPISLEGCIDPQHSQSILQSNCQIQQTELTGIVTTKECRFSAFC